MKILAVVPAYNEQDNIPEVVSDLLQSRTDIQVLVIDDGSTDQTASRAHKAGALVCTMPYNVGIGVAVQTGFIFATAHGYDVALQFDGDGQHLASEVQHLLKPLATGEANVVIGSRFLGHKTYKPPLLRRMGIALLRGLINVLCRTRLTDVTSGFRAYDATAVKFLAAHYPTQFPEPESIVWLLRHGFEIREAPVQMRERQHGQSSIGSLKSLWYMMRVSLGILVTTLRAPVNWKE